MMWLIAILLPIYAHAAEPTAAEPSHTDALVALDYPELQVVPRASERLQMEAQIEADSGWAAFWPFQLSALSTIFAGYELHGKYKDSMSADARDNADFLTNSAMGIGSAWLALSTFYIWTKPYTSDYEKVRVIKTKDRRGELLRERIAEESLERPARMVGVFTWISGLTNFLANAALIEQSTTDKNIYPAIGMIAAALPFIFTNRYVDIYDKHLEYKRKIYAPLVYMDYRRFTVASRAEPQLVFQWSF